MPLGLRPVASRTLLPRIPMQATTHSVRRTPVALTLAAFVLVLLLAALR